MVAQRRGTWKPLREFPQRKWCLLDHWGDWVFSEVGLCMCGSEPGDCGIYEGLKEIQSWLQCTVDGGKVEVWRNNAMAVSRALIVQSL